MSFLILRNKMDSAFGTDFERHMPLPEKAQSSYKWAKDTISKTASPPVLGFGYLDAVLHVLSSFVQEVHVLSPGMLGWLEGTSKTSGWAYSLSWKEEGEHCSQGGFVHGGTPNYQCALLGLVQCLCMYLSGERIQSDEIVTRWILLLREMDQHYPRRDRHMGWDPKVFSAVSRDPRLREHLLGCCDALRVAMQYHIATQTQRTFTVTEEPVVLPHDIATSPQHLSGELLLDWQGFLVLADTVPLLPTPRPISTDELAPLKAEAVRNHRPPSHTIPSPPKGVIPESPLSVNVSPAGAKGAFEWGGASPLATLTRPKGIEEVKKPATLDPPQPAPSQMHGPYIEQVEMSIAQGGSVFCTGPTGTGKTELFLENALRYNWGVELIVMHGGKRIHTLQGSYVRGESGDFVFASGPFARFARRAFYGERVVLILDELARADDKVFDYVMDLLNTFSAAQIRAMQASGDEATAFVLPSDFGTSSKERYHIVSIDALQKRFVIPASMVRIVGLANQGEGYEGHEFRDPAFLRRWYHWLHFAGYQDEVIRQILSDRLYLRPEAPLLEAMLTIKNQTHSYHARTDSLKMPLSLPLLINWGEQALWYFNHTQSSLKGDLPSAFERSARSAWLERICPYKGDTLDMEVEMALLKFVREAAKHIA